MRKTKFTILYGLAIPAVLIGLAGFLPGCKETARVEVELEMWGAFDDSDVYSSLIDEFNEEIPDTTITYRKMNYATYEQELLEAMATGRGPDIFLIHNTWAPRYADRITPVSSEQLTFKAFEESFVDVVLDDFTAADSDILALPLSVDTLALYYNKSIFNTAGIAQPPVNWDDFLTAVEQITSKDERDNVSRAGAAIGTARNINRSTDILCLLMLQSGANMTSAETNQALFDERVHLQGEYFSPGERALQFYTDFANPLKAVYTWNTYMDYSIDAFAEETAAMMLSYAYHIPTVKAKAPYLNFDVAPMPQIKDAAQAVNYANYWGLTAAANSEYPDRAWEFIVWLTNQDNAKTYLALTNRPTARRDLVDWQRDDPEIGVFAEQALTAISWYQVDDVSIEIILADMIESVVLGEATLADAVQRAANQVTLLMQE